MAKNWLQTWWQIVSFDSDTRNHDNRCYDKQQATQHDDDVLDDVRMT